MLDEDVAPNTTKYTSQSVSIVHVFFGFFYLVARHGRLWFYGTVKAKAQQQNYLYHPASCRLDRLHANNVPLGALFSDDGNETLL